MKSELYTLTSARDIFFINEEVYIEMQNRLKKIAEEQGKDSGQLEAEKNSHLFSGISIPYRLIYPILSLLLNRLAVNFHLIIPMHRNILYQKTCDRFIIFT